MQAEMVHTAKHPMTPEGYNLFNGTNFRAQIMERVQLLSIGKGREGATVCIISYPFR